MLTHLKLKFWSFIYMYTLEHILSYFRLCWLILLHGSKLRRCHKRAVGTLLRERNVTHRFHVLLQGVNGHKCSQLCVCLRGLIIIAVPYLPPPASSSHSQELLCSLSHSPQTVQLFTWEQYVINLVVFLGGVFNTLSLLDLLPSVTYITMPC